MINAFEAPTNQDIHNEMNKQMKKLAIKLLAIAAVTVAFHVAVHYVAKKA